MVSSLLPWWGGGTEDRQTSVREAAGRALRALVTGPHVAGPGSDAEDCREPF